MPSSFFQNSSSFFIGIMSGTSLDGIDCVLSTIDEDGNCKYISHVSRPYSAQMREQFLTLQRPSVNELHLEALSANDLAIEYAHAVQDLLQITEFKATQIMAIGAHGQTIRHQPASEQHLAYTWQSLNSSLLAELTQINVISDFRSRDVAAGGQGAPLVPAFHAAQFLSDLPIAILNLGGIANLTLLEPKKPVLGFDTGPANVLLNDWITQHLQLPFDENGNWAKSGQILPDFLKSMLSDPYFSAPIPKSTGRDLFHLDWLMTHLSKDNMPSAPDVQASLVELTAISIANQLQSYLPICTEMIVCGGGVQNHHLMNRIEIHCQRLVPNLQLTTTMKYGIDPQTVESLAFAWLAWCFTQGLPGNLTSVTGAKRPNILGAFYPK
jgi:anhydro-N-acetylmuramic acid kinase